MTPLSPADPVDMHVHLVGNGRSGSGCWLNVGGWWHTLLSNFMLRHVGLGGVTMKDDDFDTRYTAHLAALVRSSGIKAAVLLAQDEVYNEDGTKRAGAGSFYVPNEYLFRVCREHPEFLPACSIHPARPDALDELDRCLAAGAVMLKLLPNCHNVDCNLPRYRPFWQRMADAGLPLLAHTGGEHTLPVVRPDLADPRVLRLPLECGVKVVAAHCATKSGLGDPEYFHDLVKMLPDFPNLYADTSAFNVPLRGRHTDKCLQPEIAARLLHGSDFPVPIQPVWARLRGFISSDDYHRVRAIENVIERDYQIKLAMGFDAAHFRRVWEILRKP